MTDITEQQALEFAEAMGEEHPPTNTHLIQKHIDWWDENYPQFSDTVENWYREWTKKVNGEEIDFKEYDEAYREFMDLLNDIDQKL